MDKQDFYEQVEAILNSGNAYKEAWINNRRSGRWGPREPGNGRFKGFGLVRWFNPKLVSISLYHPYQVSYICNDEAALVYLENLLEFYRIDSIEDMFDKFRSENNGFGWS